MIENSGTRHARGCLIATRERLRAGSKQMATYQALVQTQSRCLIAARERLRARSKQMATYQAVAQTQSSSRSSVLCCSVATQTWSAYQAVAQTQSSSRSSNLCCSVATQTLSLARVPSSSSNAELQQLIKFVLLSCYTTWSAHVARSRTK